jgi:hypothetical protein
VKSEIEVKFAYQLQVITVQQGYAIREYIRFRTDFNSKDLRAEQAAWKAIYESLPEQILKHAPEVMAEIERLERLAALERVNAELEKRLGEMPTVQQIYEVRRYAASLTNLHSENLTAEQAAWKVAYESMTDALRKAAPDLMAEVEPLEEEINAAQNLTSAMKASLAAHPHDQGFRVLYAAFMIGAIIGWTHSNNIAGSLLDGLLAGLAGLFISIFILDSPYVQALLGIWFNRIGFKRLGAWLYSRSLGLHAQGTR